MTGVKAPPRAPFPLALGIATAVELLSTALGKASDLSRQLVRAAHLYTFVSSQKAENELGYSYRPLQESLRDTFRFFLRVGRLSPGTPELRQILTDGR
jgi:hypothetical protein